MRQNPHVRICGGPGSATTLVYPTSEGFPGQDSQHFRLLIAEIVAEAVCTKLIAYREQNLEYEDDDTDWNFYYSVYCGLMTEFLPIAHQVQVGDVL